MNVSRRVSHESRHWGVTMAPRSGTKLKSFRPSSFKHHINCATTATCQVSRHTFR
jgi:hypothetical protein